MPGEILIVDGNPSRLKTLQDILQTVGYGVIGAESGQEALELLNPHTIKLVFINLVLPDVSGIELLREMRPIIPNATAVLVTEAEDIIAQQEARGLRVRKWLYAPFRPEDVIRAAAESLEQASLADRNGPNVQRGSVRKGSSFPGRRISF